MKKDILIAVSKSQRGFEAHAPDYPGYLTAGKSMVEVIAKISERLRERVRRLLNDSADIPDERVFYGFVRLEMPEEVMRGGTQVFNDYMRRRGLDQPDLAAAIRVVHETEDEWGVEGRGLRGAVKFALEAKQ